MTLVDINLNDFIGFQFYQGWRGVSYAYNHTLDERVTLQYIFILQVLAEHDSLIVSELSKLINLDTSAVSTLIGRMEKKSLVRREHDLLKDRRQVLLSITAEGSKLLEKNRPIYEQYPESLFGNIDYSDKKILKCIVQKLNSNRTKQNTYL